jgi:hypothetical protein
MRPFHNSESRELEWRSRSWIAGIDWKNADFRNDENTTRIAYTFDLTDDTGAFASGNPYGLGTIYTRAEIGEALSGGLALATRDAVGHGTTTAALAVGNVRNRPDRRWRGITPRATLRSPRRRRTSA